MKLTLTTRKICPKCGTEATVEVDGFFASVIVANLLNKFDEEGGTLTASCGHSFYVEPKPKKLKKPKKPKKPTFIQRLKNALRG